jgi:uncharacterized protein YegJ (DUF2314 family)
MTEESPIAILAVVVVSLGSMVSLAAFILWLKDRPGFIGRSVKAVLGLIAVFIGFAILVWVAILIVSSEVDFWSIPRMVIGLGIPVSLVALGWLRTRGDESGVEDQEIDYDSPELRDSVLQARARLPEFVEHVRRDGENAALKFPFVTDQGVTEHLWAYVHGFNDGMFNVSLLNEPYTHEGELADEYSVPDSALEDWQILHADGRVSGAFSMIASFRYLERKGVRLNRVMRKQRAHLIDT